MHAAARSKVMGFVFLAVFDKLTTTSKNWSRLAVYADRGVIVLNKPPYLICQGSDVQDGGVGVHRLVPIYLIKFIRRTKSLEREMSINLMTCCQVSARRPVIDLP